MIPKQISKSLAQVLFLPQSPIQLEGMSPWPVQYSTALNEELVRIVSIAPDVFLSCMMNTVFPSTEFIPSSCILDMQRTAVKDAKRPEGLQ